MHADRMLTWHLAELGAVITHLPMFEFNRIENIHTFIPDLSNVIMISICTLFVIYRVLVLERSRVVEYDAPPVLLQRPDSLFYSLAKTAGLVS
jgi:hypothetical protein